jgi:hypothetical protein
MGDTGDAEVPVPGADEVSLPLRGALGIEKGGEVPLVELELPFKVRVKTGSDVNVVVSVNGRVTVVFPVLIGAVGAVGAVLKDAVVSLHGVGYGESESLAGLPSVEESTPDGTGK